MSAGPSFYHEDGRDDRTAANFSVNYSSSFENGSWSVGASGGYTDRSFDGADANRGKSEYQSIRESEKLLNYLVTSYFLFFQLKECTETFNTEEYYIRVVVKIYTWYYKLYPKPVLFYKFKQIFNIIIMKFCCDTPQENSDIEFRR